MDIAPQVTFRNVDHSEAVEARILERIDKLEQYFHHITSCRVVVEKPERRRHKGDLFHVRVDIGVPGNELVVNRQPGNKHEHEDVYVAIRDAFDAAQRQLSSYARKLSGDVKTHDGPAHAVVTRLFEGQGYGFVTMPDGQDVYFHKNAVVNGGFGKLKIGSEVRVAIAEGESPQGPQASTVDPVGKQNHAVG